MLHRGIARFCAFVLVFIVVTVTLVLVFAVVLILIVLAFVLVVTVLFVLDVAGLVRLVLAVPMSGLKIRSPRVRTGRSYGLERREENDNTQD